MSALSPGQPDPLPSRRMPEQCGAPPLTHLRPAKQRLRTPSRMAAQHDCNPNVFLRGCNNATCVNVEHCHIHPDTQYACWEVAPSQATASLVFTQLRSDQCGYCTSLLSHYPCGRCATPHPHPIDVHLREVALAVAVVTELSRDGAARMRRTRPTVMAEVSLWKEAGGTAYSSKWLLVSTSRTAPSAS